MLLVARMTATSTVDLKDDMSYRKERQRRTMVDCDKGARAKQQPTKLYVASQERATIAEREHRRRDDHVLRRVARGYDASDNG
jgi:hypothetical protein